MNDKDDALREDLKSTIVAVQKDARELVEIETEKRGLPTAHPRMQTLSRKAVKVAAGLAKLTRMEAALAEQAGES